MDGCLVVCLGEQVGRARGEHSYTRGIAAFFERARSEHTAGTIHIADEQRRERGETQNAEATRSPRGLASEARLHCNGTNRGGSPVAAGAGQVLAERASLECSTSEVVDTLAGRA